MKKKLFFLVLVEILVIAGISILVLAILLGIYILNVNPLIKIFIAFLFLLFLIAIVFYLDLKFLLKVEKKKIKDKNKFGENLQQKE